MNILTTAYLRDTQCNFMKNRITFDNVVGWLSKAGIPRHDAVAICRHDLRTGLKIFNRLKKIDKDTSWINEKVARGERLLLKI